MDACEATKVVMSRMKALDPEHASTILGLILLQGQEGEKEVIKLALAPEYLLRSCIDQAKAYMGISSTSTSSPRMLNDLHFNEPSSFPRSGTLAISFTDGSVDASGNDDFLGGGCDLDRFRLQDRNPIASPSGRNDSLTFPYSKIDWNSLPPAPPLSPAASAFSPNQGHARRLELGSPSVSPSSFNEFLRQKALQQRSPLMASGGLPRIPYNCTNLQVEYQRSEISPTGHSPRSGSPSRKIYLTFPEYSTFTYEDVASYFSTFGPVEDVGIPYQQKRMFAFVSFVYPQTVKTILATQNPHFIGDDSVTVKPYNYKEKGKLHEKKKQIEKGDYSHCLSPNGNDSIDQLHIPFGPRMLLDSQGTMLHQNFEEQMHLQNAVELQGQRMMNMQLVERHFPSSLPTSSPPSLTEFMLTLTGAAPSDPMNYGDLSTAGASPRYHVAASEERTAEFSSNNEIQHPSDAS